ncbi:MAG: glutamyl-tRNA reductase [Opitutae bacterium]|nr:glutamyl-tRNA reductase [Opitutae bacterium]
MSAAASLFIFGATHQRTPIAVREKLALAGGAADAVRAALKGLAGLREFVVLNTCNRVEFYLVAESVETVAEAERIYCAQQRFAVAEFAQFRLALQGRAAALHLFEVASGLDSQMLGETEIFGQVKDAYAAAQAAGSTGAVLNRVFQKAFQAAKHVRTQTAITEGQISVANVAVDLAVNIFGELAATRILLLGAGEIGEKTAKAFQSRGAAALTVASRSFDKAQELATTLGAAALPFAEREARLGEFDVVVCCTAAPEAVISAAGTAAALRHRTARPLFFIDLALPRDVDAAVATLENAYVYNLDDLARIAEENRRAREAEVVRARALLEERAETLWRTVAERLGGELPEAQTGAAEA